MQHPAFGDRIRAFNQRWKPGILAAALAVTTVSAGVLAPVESVLAKDQKSAAGKSRSARVVTTSRGNGAAFTINDGSNASPYSTGIDISGLTGPVQKASVSIFGIQHTNIEDVDIMLVAPGGEAAIILGDVGGENAVSGVTVNLADSNSNKMPTNGNILVSGNFRPTNGPDTGPSNDSFGTPAPTPSGTDFSTFNGAGPNGTWRLYVRDDNSNNKFGQITGGWSLSLETADPVLKAPVARNDFYSDKKNKQLKTSRADGVLRNDYSTNQGGKIVTNGLVTQPKHGNLTLRKSGAFIYKPDRDYVGKDTFVYRIKDQTGGKTAQATVSIQVKGKKNK